MGHWGRVSAPTLLDISSPSSRKISVVAPSATNALPVWLSQPRLPSMRPDYLVQRSDGSVLDTRLRFGRDARVRVTQGPYVDRLATVESLLGRWIENNRPQDEPGYNVALHDDDVVSVRWDWVVGV